MWALFINMYNAYARFYKTFLEMGLGVGLKDIFVFFIPFGYLNKRNFFRVNSSDPQCNKPYK